MQARQTLKRSALALAISLAAAAPLYAQSNSQGYIFGQVSGSGTVTVQNLGTESAPRLRSPSITSLRKFGERRPASLENERNEKPRCTRF